VIEAALVAARFAHYTALVMLFGGAVFRLFAAGEGDPRQPVPGPALLFWSSLGALVSAALVLAVTGAVMIGGLSGAYDPAVLRTLVLETGFGQIWSLRLAIATILTATLAARWARPPSGTLDTLVLLLAGAALTTVALTGHAQMRTDAAGWAHRGADALHLAAAGVWLGALPPFLVLLRRAVYAAEREAASVGRLLQRFHTVGLLAVGVLIVSGLVNSWFLVGSPTALAETAYGRVLLIKLLLFGGMTALAAGNRLRLVPRLNRALEAGLPAGAWLARLRAHVRLEFLLGLAVLLSVGVLGTLAPAAQVAP
jgi:putative copper resistance protein D